MTDEQVREELNALLDEYDEVRDRGLFMGQIHALFMAQVEQGMNKDRRYPNQDKTL